MILRSQVINPGCGDIAQQQVYNLYSDVFNFSP